jgi:hypothetical protein
MQILKKYVKEGFLRFSLDCSRSIVSSFELCSLTGDFLKKILFSFILINSTPGTDHLNYFFKGGYCSTSSKLEIVFLQEAKIPPPPIKLNVSSPR